MAQGELDADQKRVLLQMMQQANTAERTRGVLELLHRAINDEVKTLVAVSGTDNPHMELLMQLLQVCD